MSLASRVVLAACSAVCLAGPLAAQIHVSPTGSDVTGDGSAGNPYKTISFAASVAPAGETIRLSAGTFGDDEQIVLGAKDLTIVGAGIGATIVKPHPTLTNTLPRGFPPGTLDVHRVTFVVSGPARVDVRGLTVDCDFRMPSTGRLYGFFYSDGADGVVQDVEIKNVRSDPLTGAQGPAGAVVRGDDAVDPCVVTFRTCLVHEWGKAGLVSFFNADMTVEHCTVVGSGPVGVPLPAQNCIQVSYDSTATLRFNRITDSRYLPNTYGAGGILLYDAGPDVVVEGNEVRGCEVGIWAIQSVPLAVPCAIRGNRVTGSAADAIAIQGQSGVSVVNNVAHMVLAGAEAAWDDAAGNTWSDNNYSDWSGAGSYLVAGGPSVDANPRRSCDDFGVASGVALGRVPVSVLALDLDGAGGTDFVTVNEDSSPTLTIGLEAGGVYPTSEVAFGNSGGRPVAIAAGDFDGAGGLDLAVLTVNVPPATTENKVYLFTNSAGSFTLAHTETLPAGVLSPSDLAVGDLDGANVDDLVVADLGGIATPGGGHVLLNGGAIGSWAASALPVAATTQCQGVAVGDLDGDFDLDVAITEGSGTMGAVHLFANDGAGGFSAMPGSPVAIDPNPNDVAIHDVDADGAPDVLVACFGASLPIDEGSVVVLVNDLPAGMTPVAFRTDRGPSCVAAGDFGDDDDPDTVRRDAVVVNLVAGDLTLLGAFDADAGSGAGFATAGLCLAGTSPRAATFADMDGDRYPDLCVADAAGQAVLILPGRPTWRVDLYGAGCAGTQDRIPRIRTAGAPAIAFQPNLTFGIELRDARPLSVAVLDASVLPAATSGPCQFLLASIDVSWLAFTTAAGTASFSIPVPAAPPALLGVRLYFQWAVIDPEGDFFGAIALSQGLALRVGI